MNRLSRIVLSWTSCLLCAFCASDGPCTAACALGIAFSATVTSSVSGAPVAGAYITGDSYSVRDSEPCNEAPGSTCYMRGLAGNYTVEIGAPGFQSVQRNITVKQGSGRCCPGTIPGHLDVALVPAP